MVREFRGSTEPSTVRTARPADTLTSLTFPASRTILKVTWQVAKNKAIVSLLRIRIQGQRAAEMDALQMCALALFLSFFVSHLLCSFAHSVYVSSFTAFRVSRSLTHFLSHPLILLFGSFDQGVGKRRPPPCTAVGCFPRRWIISKNDM